MTNKEGEEVPCLRKTKGGLDDSALSLMVIEVNHTEGRPKEQLEQVSTVLLANEQLRVRVNVLHRLGIRNHKVLFLRNQVTNCNRSRLSGRGHLLTLTVAALRYSLTPQTPEDQTTGTRWYR